MVWRILLVATLVSRRDPVISDGAFLEITVVMLGEVDATGVGAAVGVTAAGTGFPATGVAGAALTGSAV